jgi:hypothetical protein
MIPPSTVALKEGTIELIPIEHHRPALDNKLQLEADLER